MIEQEAIQVSLFSREIMIALITGGGSVVAAIIGFLTVRYNWRKRTWFRKTEPKTDIK